MSDDTVAAFTALATELGLAVEPPADDLPPGRPHAHRASGRVDGYDVHVGPVRSNRAEIPVRVAMSPARDLRLEVFTKRPRHAFQQHDAVQSGSLWIRGDGDRERLRALLAGDAGVRLRELRHLDAQLDDRCVIAYLNILDDGPSLARDVHHLTALADAVDEAAARVPVDPTVAWAGLRFAVAADALGLEFSPCPLGLRGELDGCAITTHTMWTRPHRTMFIHVGLRRVIPGSWALRAQGRTWWQRLRAGVGVLLGGGPGSGRFAFDRRFYLGHGDRELALRAVEGRLDPLIEFVDRNWLTVQGDRILVGFRLRERTMPDVTDLVRRAVAIAHLVGGGPDPRPSDGPFR